MRTGAIYRAGSNECLIPKVQKTNSTWERMRGLLGRPPLAVDEGLLISPCPSVHTFGMRYSLDLIFLAADGRVVKLVRGLAPWRMTGCATAQTTIELAPGSIERSGISLVDQLEWRSN